MHALTHRVSKALNTIIMFTEKRKSDNALAALAESLAPTALVLRDGMMKEMDAKLLVPGDVIKLSLGCVVPADCIVAARIR